MMPSVSIITINLNNKKGLEKTIESVVRQSSKALQFVVIDGGSTDESVSVIKRFERFIDYWVSEKDNGIYDAMNKGIRAASGNYLMFLNSGDVLGDDNVITACQNRIERNSEIDILYGDCFWIDKSGKHRVYKHPENLTVAFFKKNTINHQAALIRANLFDEFGLYKEKYKLANDYWLFMTSFVNDKIFVGFDYSMVNYEGGGISAQNWTNYEKEMADMWKDEVPKYVDDLVNDYFTVEYAKHYKFLKLIVPIRHALVYQKRKMLIAAIILLAFVFLIKMVK